MLEQGSAGEAPAVRRLIEREAEMAALDARLAEAGEGHGGMVVFEGRAGLGKSALMRLAVAKGASAGHEVLRATGSELERDFPFGGALQMVEPVLAGGRVDQRDALLAGAAGLTRPLLEPGVPVRTTSAAQLFPLVHGLYWLVANLAEDRPVAVAIDDAHWLDRPSLMFLAYLAHRVEGLPVSIVLAVRPLEEQPSRDLLSPLLAHPAARVRLLEPLTAKGTQMALEDRVPGADERFCDACAAVTGGNPFLLNELLLALEADGVEPVGESSAQVSLVAPEAVLRSMLARLAQLPGAASAMARAVAVLGDDAELRHAAALAEVPIEEAEAAANALVAAEILAEGHPLAFAHPLLQSTVADDMAEGDRARSHARAARLLAGDGNRAERVASHLVGARPAGDPWVVDCLREAALRASTEGAPQSAALFLRRALEEPPTVDARPDLLVALGEAEAASGQPGALSRFDEATDLCDDPCARAEIRLRHGEALMAAGREREAAETIDLGLADVGDAHEALATRLEAAWLSAARHLPEQRERAQERLRPILERASSHDTYEERWLLANVAHQRAFAGEPHEETVALARRALDGPLPTEGIGPLIAISPLAWADDFDGYEEVARAALAQAQSRGSIAGFASASFALSFTGYFRGRLADAQADAQQAIDSERDGWAEYSPAARVQLSWTLIERDELDVAERALEVPGLEDQWAGSAMYALVADARCRLALARGDADAALESAERAGEIGRALGFVNPACLPWRSNMGLAALATGDRARAVELCEEELALARRFGAPRGIGVAQRALGLVTSPEEGLAHLEDAVSTLEDSPAALEHCRALVDLGAARRRAGQRRQAREALEQGLRLARGFAAVALERRAEQELKAAGARPRRRELTGVGSLTPSERRVAEMAAQGLSNRQIAQALFVTKKAVAFHLGNTYRKLEIGGRDELPAALAEGAR